MAKDKEEKSLEVEVGVKTIDRIEEEVEMKEEQNSRKQLCVILAVKFIILVGLYLIFGKEAIHWFHDELGSMVRSKSIWAKIFLLLCQVPFGVVLFLPGLFYFNIMQAVLMQDMVQSWFISFVGSYVTAMAVFGVVHHCCHEAVLKRFQHYEPFIMFEEETKEHPIRDGILLNFVFIPISVKNYLVAISSLKFWQAAVAFIPGNFIFCFMSAMVGSEINDLKDLAAHKSFSQKTMLQKLEFFMSIIMIILTFSLIVYIALHYKKKYSAFRMRRNSLEPIKEEPTKVDDNQTHDTSIL